MHVRFEMKTRLLLVSAIVAMAVALPVHAQPAPPGCHTALDGKVSCPPLGGELVVTLSGEAVCGKGRCVRDLFGKVTCSAQPGGSITQDATGRVTCTGGCEEASAANCQRLQ
jgi:hypothetical protein